MAEGLAAYVNCLNCYYPPKLFVRQKIWAYATISSQILG